MYLLLIIFFNLERFNFSIVDGDPFYNNWLIVVNVLKKKDIYVVYMSRWKVDLEQTL